MKNFKLYMRKGAAHPTIDKEKLAAIIPSVTEETPSFKDIFISNVTCTEAGRAILLQGLPEMNLKNIRLNNVRIEAIKGIEMIDADGIEMKNVSPVREMVWRVFPASGHSPDAGRIHRR